MLTYNIFEKFLKNIEKYNKNTIFPTSRYELKKRGLILKKNSDTQTKHKSINSNNPSTKSLTSDHDTGKNIGC
jgi:hypothetical protein